MTTSRKHFEEFHSHTLLKHRILKAYLSSWAFKLLQSRSTQHVYFVDAFAGPGKDEAGNPGSPLIAARIACQVKEHLNQSARTAGRKMRLIAIEEKPRYFAQLRRCLEAFNKHDANLCTPLKGELKEHIDDIVARAADDPILTFLDTFGTKGLDASTYPKALSGEHAEIFALFPDMGSGRLHGVVTAAIPNLEEQISEITAAPSLFPELDKQKIQEVTDEALEYARALDVTKPACIAHLTRALGNSTWESELAHIDLSERPRAFVRLFIRSLLLAGAKWIITLPMRDEDGRRVYSLVHASKSEAGFLAMKEAVSTGLNTGVLPLDVVSMIKADLSVPVNSLVRGLGKTFRGRSLGWTQVVKPWLLKATPVFNFQLEEVKGTLIEAGIIPRASSGKPKIPIVCNFPGESD